MKAWWDENRLEVIAGLFLLCLLICAVGVVFQSLDGQASPVRICQTR